MKTIPILIAKDGPAIARYPVQTIRSRVEYPVLMEVLGEAMKGAVRDEFGTVWRSADSVARPSARATGLEATSVDSYDGIRVDQTLCFSADQALLATLAGAHAATMPSFVPVKTVDRSMTYTRPARFQVDQEQATSDGR